MEGFALPPVYMTTPLFAQTVVTGVLFGLYAIAIVAAIIEWRRSGAPLMFFLLIGGALCCVLEPLWDVISHIWFAIPGQWAGMRAFNISVPIWGYPAYALYFGLTAYLLLIQLRRGIGLRALRVAFALLIVGNLLLEIPILQTGIYVYYGNQGITVGGMPLYWLFIQVGSPLATAVVIHRRWVNLWDGGSLARSCCHRRRRWR